MVSDELKHALEKEQKWREHLSSQDTGSYCENASPEALAASKVRRAYQGLVDVLLEHQRSGYRSPK